MSLSTHTVCAESLELRTTPSNARHPGLVQRKVLVKAVLLNGTKNLISNCQFSNL